MRHASEIQIVNHSGAWFLKLRRRYLCKSGRFAARYWFGASVVSFQSAGLAALRLTDIARQAHCTKENP